MNENDRKIPTGNPWHYLQPHDVARFGEIINDPDEQFRWCNALFLGGLPWMWKRATVLRDLIFQKLDLAAGHRVLLIGESVEGMGFDSDIRARIGEQGELRIVDMIERVRDSARDGTKGRGGKSATFEYDFTYADPDGHYDAVAILQGVAHSDDWPATARELIRVLKAGRPIVLAEIGFGPPLIMKAQLDLHLEYWLEKMMAGRRRRIEDSPYVSLEELQAAFAGLLREDGTFSWKGADVMWGLKPSA